MQPKYWVFWPVKISAGERAKRTPSVERIEIGRSRLRGPGQQFSDSNLEMVDSFVSLLRRIFVARHGFLSNEFKLQIASAGDSTCCAVAWKFVDDQKRYTATSLGAETRTSCRPSHLRHILSHILDRPVILSARPDEVPTTSNCQHSITTIGRNAQTHT